MHPLRFVLLSTFCFSLNAFAQDTPSPSAWTQEPTTFLGIQLGQPISASLPECIDRRLHPDTRPCFKPDLTADRFTMPEIRNNNRFPSVNVSALDGKVEYIAATHHGSESGDLLASMTQQFGPPQKHTSKPVQTLGGAQFSQDEYTWVGTKVTLSYTTNVGKVNDDFIEARTAAFDVYSANERKKAKPTNIF